MDLQAELLEQLTLHWETTLRPRLAGLTDDEYFWEPAAGAWSVRPRGRARTAMAAGGAGYLIDFALPQPDPAPVTTVAWRLGHVIVGVFGVRSAAHFGGPPVDYFTHEYAPDAATALEQLDREYARWVEGVRSLDAAGLARPCGPAEGPYADRSMATLVLHIHREVIHHGAEVCLLRDLYAHRGRPPTGSGDRSS